MIRNAVFALAAVATLAATALIPSEAAAKGFKGGYYYGWGGGWGRYAVGSAIVLGTAAVVTSSCYQWVQLPNGVMVRQWVCN
jgi:hypothetical protein